MLKYLCAFLLTLCAVAVRGQDNSRDSALAANLLKDAKSLFISDKSACLTKAYDALEVVRKTKYKSIEGDIDNLLGVLLLYQAKYDVSLNYLNQAMQIGRDTKNNLLISKVYINRGLNYMQQGNQLKAVDESINAIKFIEKTGNNSLLADTYANISSAYVNIKTPTKALFYADSALKYFKIVNKSTGIANIYNTYGYIYSDQKQYKKALNYYSMSLKIKQDINDQTGQANTLLNIGETYLELKENKKAKYNFGEALKLYKIVNDPKGFTEVATNMAKLKALEKDTTALQDSKIAYDYARKNTTIEQQRDIAENVASNYEVRKDYKNSLKYYKLYDSLKNKTISEAILKNITGLEAKFQTEKKEQQIVLLNKQSTIQNLQLAKKNMTIIVIASIFLLFIFISYLSYNRYKLKQVAILQNAIIQQQDVASKRIIEAEEAERKRIAGDLHDGVGQLFSTVKMNLETLIERFIVSQPDANILAEKTMAMVDESCIEVRSIAHQMMPNALIKSGLVSAVRDFVNKIHSERLKISVETKGINERLETSVETVLYRVIQESVNNVIKHANATTLDILLLCDDREITVTIEDNGKGFDTNEQSQFKGIGLKNMTSRVEY